MKKFLVVIVTKDSVLEEVHRAALNQDYQNFDVLINTKKPVLFDDRPNVNFLFNMNANRLEAREKALKTDADYFLLIDDDVVLPTHALTEFMKQYNARQTTIDWKLPDGKIIPKGTPLPEKHVIGGWYEHGPDEWNAGRWVADCTMCNLKYPEKGMIVVDKIDMGCISMSREVMEKIPPRIDLDMRYRFYGSDSEHMFCECLAFGEDANRLGYQMWINGSVICRHIKEKRDGRRSRCREDQPQTSADY